VLRAPAAKAPALVACYIGAAYWFTASTSFANPAAVLGRMLSDSFAGIAPASAAGFVLAQAWGRWPVWRCTARWAGSRPQATEG
jgi:glycerol uptake facilitator-like aquaporin